MVTKFVGLVLILLTVAGCTSSYHNIEQGHYGVVIHYGQNGEKPTVTAVQPGVGFWVNGWSERLVDYPSSQQSLTMVRNIQEGQVKGDDSISCHDSNGVPYNLDATLTWRVDPAHVADLYIIRPNLPLVSDKNDGQDIQTQVVRRIARSVIPVACGSQVYTDIYTAAGKLRLQSDGLKLMQSESAKEFVQVDGFYPGEVYLQSAQQDAISRTANAQAAVAVAAQAKQQAENEAQGVVAKANGEATAVSIRALASANETTVGAQAQATAVALQANAEASLNRTVDPTLNANVIQAQEIRRWNGQLPQVQGVSGNSPIQLPAQLPASANSSASVGR